MRRLTLTLQGPSAGGPWETSQLTTRAADGAPSNFLFKWKFGTQQLFEADSHFVSSPQTARKEAADTPAAAAAAAAATAAATTAAAAAAATASTAATAAMGGEARLLNLLRLPAATEPPPAAAAGPEAAAAAGEDPGIFRQSAAPDCSAVYVLPRCSDSPANCPYTPDESPLSFYSPLSTPGASSSPVSLSPLPARTQARIHSVSPLSSRSSSSSSSSIHGSRGGPCCCTSCGICIYLCVHFPHERALGCARWEQRTPQQQQQQQQEEEQQEQQLDFTCRTWQLALPSQTGDGAVSFLRWIEVERGRLALLAGCANGVLCVYTWGGVSCVWCSLLPLAILDVQLASSSSSSNSSSNSSRCRSGMECSCVGEDCVIVLLLGDSHVAAVGVSALKAAAAAAEARAAKRMEKGRPPLFVEHRLPFVLTRLEGREATVGAVVAGGPAAAAAAAGPRLPDAAAAEELRSLLQQLDGSDEQRQQQQQQQQIYATSFRSAAGDSRTRRRRRSASLRPPWLQQPQLSPLSPERRQHTHSPQQQQQEVLLLAAGSEPLLSLHSLQLGDGQESRRFSFFAVAAAAAAGKLAAAAARKALLSAAVEAPLLQCGWDDEQRGAVCLSLCSWDASVAALSDSLGRVSLISVSSLLPLWMLKGYRNAQLAWLRRPPARCKDTSAAAPDAGAPSGGLVVLAPKRGLLELFAGASERRLAVALNIRPDARLLPISVRPISSV
ncbi:hypothetical protein Efla_007478 [Eimeria flavescens]